MMRAAEFFSRFREEYALKEGAFMDNKKKTDDNLPKNKEYIEKFYRKSEEEIKKQTGEGRVKGNGKE